MCRRVFVVAILITIFFVIVYINKEKTTYIPRNIESSINYYNNYVLNNISEFDGYFKDRYISMNNRGVTIGNSKNEIDNGYYDINIDINNKQKHIEIYVNKLFKEFDKNILCDDKYVGDLIEYIMKVFKLTIDKIELAKLIVNNYQLIRDIDRNKVENVDKVVKISNTNISITVKENILVLKMGDI